MTWFKTNKANIEINEEGRLRQISPMNGSVKKYIKGSIDGIKRANITATNGTNYLTFDTIYQASKILGINKGSIYSHLRGERARAGGYVFEKCN